MPICPLQFSFFLVYLCLPGTGKPNKPKAKLEAMAVNHCFLTDYSEYEM